MKIAIVGKDSYIGNALDHYATAQGATVIQVDAIDGKWKAFDFSSVDAVVCVAAIVHRKDIKDYSIYREINTKMPCEIAQKVKEAGVKQFVFLSTMAVYGQTKKLTGNVITKSTPCEPIDFYGKSKLEAEKLLLQEQSESFNVCIVRPANVYGKGCKGNYMLYFQKLARLCPVIPDVYREAKQGLVYIENLCQLVYLTLKFSAKGIYHAQDRQAVSSAELMAAISESQGQKKKYSRAFGGVFKLLRISLTNKIFGGVLYADDLLQCELGEWNTVEFGEGIKRTFK